MKYTFGPVRGNYLESYLITVKVSQCALFSFSVLNSLLLCIFLSSSAQFHARADAHAPPLHPVILQLAVILSCYFSSSVTRHGIPPSHLFSDKGFIEALLYRPGFQPLFQQEKEDMEGKNIKSKQYRCKNIHTIHILAVPPLLHLMLFSS